MKERYNTPEVAGSGPRRTSHTGLRLVKSGESRDDDGLERQGVRRELSRRFDRPYPGRSGTGEKASLGRPCNGR